MAEPSFQLREDLLHAPPQHQTPTGVHDQGAAARAQSAELQDYAGSTDTARATQNDPFSELKSKLGRAAKVSEQLAEGLHSAAATLGQDPDPGARALAAKLSEIAQGTQAASAKLQLAQAKLSTPLERLSTLRQLAEMIDAIQGANSALRTFKNAHARDQPEAAMALGTSLGTAFARAGAIASHLPGPLAEYVGGLFATPEKVVAEFNRLVNERILRLDKGAGSGYGERCIDPIDGRILAEGPDAREVCLPPAVLIGGR